MSEKFVPTKNLNNFSEEDKQRYYLAACAHFNLPPDLNLLYFDWVDNGEGGRNLVLATTKGATDIVRDRLGITIIDLKMEEGFGCVNFIAIGQNAKGRVERAVGSCSLDGLKGRAVEIAVMTAQTRALKRMTLQFIGGGLLDETETGAPTPTKPAPELKEVAPMIPPVVKPAETGPTPVQLAAQKALETVQPQVLAQAAGDSPAQNPSKEGVSSPKISELPAPASITEPAFESPRRRSRKAAEVSFNIPFKLAETPAPVPALPVAPVLTRLDPPKQPVSPETPAPKTVLDVVVDEAVKTAAKELMPPAGVPDLMQMKGFRDRLFKYTNDIFPKAGMVPSIEGGGVAQKTRKFAQAKFGVSEMNQLTAVQWESLFEYWDGMIKEHGAKALVKVIDDVAEGRMKL